MNLHELQLQSISLHSELEGAILTRKDLLKKIKEMANLLSSVKRREKEIKKAIDSNLDRQEIFWGKPKEGENEAAIVQLTIVQDYMLNPDQTFKELASKHGVSMQKVHVQLTKALKTA